MQVMLKLLALQEHAPYMYISCPAGQHLPWLWPRFACSAEDGQVNISLSQQPPALHVSFHLSPEKE